MKRTYIRSAAIAVFVAIVVAPVVCVAAILMLG